MLRRNILIFHNAALGDFVVTWPLAMACGRMFPQSRVIYVTAGGKGKLAEDVLGVESTDIESGWAGLWGDPATVAPAAHRLLAGAQAVFSFVADGAEGWDANVRSIAPESPVFHLTTKLEGWRQHVSRGLVHQLEAFNPAVASGVGQMIDSLGRRGFGRRSPAADGVLVHPGSGAERKNWPRERFVETCRQLQGAGRSVRVVLGEVELEKWGTAARDEFSRYAQVVEPRSLVELAQLCGAARVVLCNDSGPGHLAGILGVPTVSLFGPTSDATGWSPLGPAVRLVQSSESMQAIAVEAVISAIDERINSHAPAAPPEETPD